MPAPDPAEHPRPLLVVGSYVRGPLTKTSQRETTTMAKKKSKSDSETKDTPDQPLGGISADQLQVLFFQHKGNYVAALAAKKKTDADFKNMAKRVKADLGELGIDQIKLAIRLETPEGEAEVRGEIAGMQQVAAWVGADIGTEFEMDLGDGGRAFNEGKRAGMLGEPKKPPKAYAPDSIDYQKWLEGHGDGNAALLTKGIKPTEGDEGEPPIGMSRADWKKSMQDLAASGDKHIREVAPKPPASH